MGKDLMSFTPEIFSLKDKVIMITGANQGLGMAYAIALARMGADIFVPHFTEDVSEVRQKVESMGSRIGFSRGDLTDPAYREKCVQDCMDMYGRIDVLINNAGTNFAAAYIDFPDEKWKMVIDLQLEAVHYLSHLVAPIMRQQGGGKIVNVASALSFSADLNATAYTVAKHGIVGLTRSLAAELGRYNITANAIAPGFFESDANIMIRNADPKMFGKVCDRIPLNTGESWGDIYDLMGPMVFLCSPASDYVSGDVLVVDGGFKAQMV